MNQFLATAISAAMLAIAGVTSGFTETIATAWNLRSVEDVKRLKQPDPSGSACPAPRELTLHPDRDSHISLGFSGTSFGRQTTLAVESSARSAGGIADQRTLIGFDLRPVSPFCTVTSAHLQLFATSSSGERTINVYRLGGSWSEDSVSWSNQPPVTGSASSTTSEAGWQTWDVTEHITAMISGRNNGLLLRDSDEGSPVRQAQVYRSREGAAGGGAPQLILKVE